MRPVGQIALRFGQSEFDLQLAARFFDTLQLPVACAGQAMGWCLLATVHGLNGWRVALQIAEPRPAHGYTRTHRFAFAEDGLIAQPQQRLLVHLLVAEDLRTLLGDQQFGSVAGDAPAVEFAV
ncbi:hypothetical protein D3C71_1676210 [compost metagenome]